MILTLVMQEFLYTVGMSIQMIHDSTLHILILLIEESPLRYAVLLFANQ